MFKLNNREFGILRSQFATSKSAVKKTTKTGIETIGERGGSRYLPMVFTEHGVLMLSSVLNSKQAIAVNIQIMRIFSRFREMLITNQEIMERLEKLEKNLLKSDHQFKQLEEEIQLVFGALKKMMEERLIVNKIGFRRKEEGD